MVTSLKELDRNLSGLGSKLNLFYGDNIDVIKDVVKQNSVDAIFYNIDYTPFSKKRDAEIEALASSLGIKVFSLEDALINKVNSIENNKSFYKVFTPYYNSIKDKEVDKPHTEEAELKKFRNSKKDILSKYIMSFNKTDNFYEYNENISSQGGREEALETLKKDFSKYGERRNLPYISTTKLSAHLKFGTVSVREAVYAYRSVPELVRQIYWRDFWAGITYFNENILKNSFYPKYDSMVWDKNPLFDLWKEGKTGVPIVDAGMRELNTTGFMHNRLRMLTASFLIKNLHVDWRLGAKYFAQKLIDYCPMQNQNNWQSVAGVGASALAWFRVMNPFLQQKKYDPSCRYIKKWIPELKAVNIDRIHKWDISQENSGYPEPIVDLKSSSKEFINRVKDL